MDGKNSSEVWSSHRVGGRAGIVERTVSDAKVCAAHNGYRSVIHKRTWCWDGNTILIDDDLEGRGKHKVELYLHFMPGEAVSRCSANEFSTSSGLVITFPERGEKELQNSAMGMEFGNEISNITLRLLLEGDLPLRIRTKIADRGS